MVLVLPDELRCVRVWLNHVHLVSPTRRKRSRGRASFGAEAFLELPAVLRPWAFLCALSWEQNSLSLSSPGGPHAHHIPKKKLWVLWWHEVRRYGGCLMDA